MSVTPAATAVTKPLTGDEYLESLRDGREVWIYGERVDDVTTHPAFRNSARSIARLYDALHEDAAAGRNVISAPTDTGNGGFTHPYFVTPRSKADLRAGRNAITEWARLTYGWMGRSPDYKAAFLVTLDANADYYAPYQDNARAWYRKAQESVLYLNHAIVNPPVDRNRPPDEVADVFVHIEEENDNGIVVSGAKVVATNSALTHCNFIAHYGMPLKRREYAVMFIAPMDTPGVKLMSRASYEYVAAKTSSPFDYPLSSRFDENDSVMIFDKALIPWENVLVCGDADKMNGFVPASGFLQRFTLQGVTRLAVKLDFISGLLLKAVAIAGTNEFRGVQASVGEVLAWRNTMWALSDAMIEGAGDWVNGAVQPKWEYSQAYRVLAPMAYGKVREIIENTVGSGLIYLNSHAKDFKSDELRPYLDRYMRGSNGYDAESRAKVLKLLWDAVGSEFGARHELYERNYAGSAEAARMETLLLAEANGVADGLRGFVDSCMAEYDLDGWTAPDMLAASNGSGPS